MQAIYQDLRFALRPLRKSPGFTLLATLTLAIGIGAATAVFSLVDAVMLRPLPFPQSGRLVALDTLNRPQSGGAPFPNETSYPNFFDWRDQAKSFDSMACWQAGGFNLSGGNGVAQHIAGMIVSADYFRVLRVDPILGRSFLRSEEAAGNRSIILSRNLWQTLFDSSAGALGRTVRLDGEAYTVVGVMPSGLRLPGVDDAEIWLTPARDMEGKNPSGKQRGWSQLGVLARLAPGATLEEARAELNRIQHNIAVQYPDDAKNDDTASVTPLLEDLVGDVRRPLQILFASVCMLLLIACANVAGLLLARGVSRRGELSIRAAFGASRIQIMRQLLIESFAMSVLGAVPGIALAWGALRFSPLYLPPSLPRVAGIAMDGRVLLFAVGLALLTSLLFGALPAWRISRLDPAEALRDQSRRSTSGRGQQRLQATLAVAETAVGLNLLVGAGLLIRSFSQILDVRPGFDPSHMLTFRVGVPENQLSNQQMVELGDHIQTRLAALPGVEQATYGFPLPVTGSDITIGFDIEGRPALPGDQPSARVSAVALNFFQTMRTPLLHGRLFTSADLREGGAPSVIVNQAFAAKFFPGEDALGKRIRSGIGNAEVSPMREIVGVVANVYRKGLTERPQPEYYIPFAQASITSPRFAMRVAGDPAGYSETVRKAVAAEAPGMPVFKLQTYDQLLEASTAQERFQTLLLTAFAGIALLLAALGLYGVLSYMVTQRTQELGLRIALGAQRSDVLSLVLKRGLVLTSIGLALGLGVSALVTRYLSSLLFHTKPIDAATFASTTALLLAVSTAACLAPALRASRLDPNTTLRQQ